MHEYRSDVLVVGGGLTGIVAAIELLSAGRSVTLLDRDVEAHLGGLARESFGGLLLVDTREQRRAGIRDSVELALRDWLRFGGFGTDPQAEHWPRQWAQAYLTECGDDVYRWLLGLGIRFLPLPLWVERGLFGEGNSVPRWHVTWGSGERLATRMIEILRSHPRQQALTLRFGHRVESLFETGGRVAGARGVTEHGGEAFVAWADAVLVAAGGINGSIERVRRHWHGDWRRPPETVLNGSHRYADGRLHDAVEAVGGRVTNLDRMWNYAAGVHHWAPLAAARSFAGTAEIGAVARLAGPPDRADAAGERLRHARSRHAGVRAGARLFVAAAQHTDRAQGARGVGRGVQPVAARAQRRALRPRFAAG